ncbi:Malate dehydrogenase 2, partial [Durusdinium trenchii]
KASQRICGRAGLTPCQNSKPGKHLPAGHPLLRKVIEHIRLQRASQQVHPLLIGNFDQVALNMPVTENVETHRIRHDPKPNVIQGGSYGSNAVDAWRVPHTLTTLSWLDGSVGGFGAAGQPNDGFHQFLHLFTHAYMRCSINWQSNLDLRLRLDQLQLGVQTSVSTKLNGMMVWSAWVQRGYCTLEEIAEWRFGGVTENASKAYRRDRSSLCDLLQLEELPVISENAHLEKLESLRMTPLPGEEQVVWAIQDVNLPQTRQILPDWLSSPMAVQLLKWKSDKEKWNIKIAKRPNNTLTPHMQKKFDEWEIHNKERPLLFRKSKQALVPYVKDHTELKKIRSDLCIATLELNDDVSKLRVRAGDGAVKQLVALRCQACEGVAIPDCLSKAFPDSAMEGVLPTCLEDADDRGGRIEEEEEEAFLDASEQEAKAMIVEEMNATGDECPSEAEDLDLDPIDILAITDDEEELQKDLFGSLNLSSEDSEAEITFCRRLTIFEWYAAAWLFLPYLLWGFGRGSYESVNRAALADFYRGKKIDAAFANFTFQQCMASAIAFFVNRAKVSVTVTTIMALLIMPCYVLVMQRCSGEQRPVLQDPRTSAN